MDDRKRSRRDEGGGHGPPPSWHAPPPHWAGGHGPPPLPPGPPPTLGLSCTNDYQQHFVDTGERPQNFIRDTELAERFEENPQRRELASRKEALLRQRATPPAYLRCDLRTFPLSAASLGTQFDVILIDPPCDEYARRASAHGGAAVPSWSWEEIAALRVEEVADSPCFLFLWCGSAEGLSQGRACLSKWGFRRIEEVVWLKTNRGGEVPPGGAENEDSVLQTCKEHCLVGLKGSARRSSDGHILHANSDTDVIVSEQPPYGGSEKPEELYTIIEHFAQGRRRLELFGEDHNIRPGWLTLGGALTSSNFDAKAYGEQVGLSAQWTGAQGQALPGAPWLMGTTPEIEQLRPRSPRGGGGGGRGAPSGGRPREEE